MDTKMKTDWENTLDELMNTDLGSANMFYPKLIKSFIRDLLAKQEEQHKAETERLMREINTFHKDYVEELKQQHKAELDLLIEAVKLQNRLLQGWADKVKQLKKQHVTNLESFKNELLAWAGLHRGKSIDEKAMPRFHEIIDNLLEQKGK